MSHAQKDALIMRLFDLLEGLERRVEELERKVEKTSRNSSKPPSSDGLKKGAAEPRKRGEKPSGSQPGHPGRTRTRVEHPDVAVEMLPPGACGRELGTQGAQLK